MKFKNKNGFILIYTIILVSIVLVIVILNFNQSYSEIYSSRNAEESVKALYAAQTGLECVRYWHTNYRVFDTSKPPTDYSCGIGPAFRAGRGDSVCQNDSYLFPITGFSNGACTEVSVKTTAYTIMVGTTPQTFCTISVVSTGRNSCSAVGSKKVERVLLENM